MKSGSATCARTSADADLQRLDLQMQHLGAVRREAVEVEPVQNAERDQRRDALAVRRQLVDAMAAELDVDRRRSSRT